MVYTGYGLLLHLQVVTGTSVGRDIEIRKTWVRLVVVL